MRVAASLASWRILMTGSRWVLALPRGGVAVGFEIAQALNAPLDIVLVRKIGVPWQPELALGAVTDGASPEIFIDRDMAAVLDIPETYVQEATVRQLDERGAATRPQLRPRHRPAFLQSGHIEV